MYSSCHGDLNDSGQPVTTVDSQRYMSTSTSRSLLDSLAANVDLTRHSLLLSAATRRSSVFESKRSDTAPASGCCDEHHTCESKKRPRSTFPFGKCKVCSDKATGVHYGIATCEGCKVNGLVSWLLPSPHFRLFLLSRAFSSGAFFETSSTGAFSATTA